MGNEESRFNKNELPKRIYFKKGGGTKGKALTTICPIITMNKIGSAACETCSNLFMISVDEMWVMCSAQ